ncbi:MAG: hypothetical protein QOH06_4308 [Acidobacteriota bacterium]|jgi:hypothetical protein|nr:hypothetical protein [Acidobacteriota bacterium]
MGQEKSRRVWPHGANHVLATRATGEQLIRWHQAAAMGTMKPHLGIFLASAADHYARHLQRRMKRALDLQAKEDREKREREGKP